MSSIVFIGGPGSGKSNFLFRCWISIERELGKLVKVGLPDDLAYLNSGATALLEGRFAPHTSRDDGSTCRIPVKFRERTVPTNEITIPDVSGELWTDLFEKREWPIAWDEYLVAGAGFVLFIQADSPHNVSSLDWVTCERFYQDKTKVTGQAETPTQVVLVDWLQILRAELDKKVGASARARLSVVISAWDRVQGEEGKSPATYLSLRFPLLADFIDSNDHRFDIQIFGVSVSSGDLDKNDRFREKYMAGDPSLQGYSVSKLVGGRLRRSDVLDPVYWALSETHD